MPPRVFLTREDIDNLKPMLDPREIKDKPKPAGTCLVVGVKGFYREFSIYSHPNSPAAQQENKQGVTAPKTTPNKFVKFVSSIFKPPAP